MGLMVVGVAIYIFGIISGILALLYIAASRMEEEDG